MSMIVMIGIDHKKSVGVDLVKHSGFKSILL